MNVELQIDELILHGFDPRERQRIGAAVQQELTRLLGAQGVPQGLAQGGRFEQVNAGAFTVAPGMSAEAIGAQVAQAVYGGLSR